MKTYTKEYLQTYVGRKFIICKTRYGALDGFTGTVQAVEMVPMGKSEVPMLIVTIPNVAFSPAMMLPDNFVSEVKE